MGCGCNAALYLVSMAYSEEVGWYGLVAGLVVLETLGLMVAYGWLNGGKMVVSTAC